MAHPLNTSAGTPRPAAPGVIAVIAPTPADTGRPTPGQAAAGIATGVLCLWTPFTLVLALLLNTLPDTLPACANSSAAICTTTGHLAATWSATTGSTLGLATVALGSWVHPRRHHALLALTALATAAVGLLVTLGLATTAPQP